jgi:hypothetical protein
MAPCPPEPLTVISKASAAAIMGPAFVAAVRTAGPGHRCSAKIEPTPSATPSSTIARPPAWPSSAGWKTNLTVPFSRSRSDPREGAGGPDEHARVAIMPTSVHHAVRQRGERKVRLLVNRQGVHVGPEGHRRAVASLALQCRDHAVLGDASLNLQRQAVERVQDFFGGLFRVEAEFGFPVNVAPQGDYVLA